MKPEKNILIACTGSVATIKLPVLIESLRASQSPYIFKIKVVLTDCAKHFCEVDGKMPDDVPVFDNATEWTTWTKRGDSVLHIDIGKWADMLLIAPLSANSLAKMATGICDNFLMCIVRAWDFEKPLIFCPAMNTRMYEHPLTREQIEKLKSWGYFEVPCTAKTLMCGDTGNGAMASVPEIVSKVLETF